MSDWQQFLDAVEATGLTHHQKCVLVGEAGRVVAEANKEFNKWFRQAARMQEERDFAREVVGDLADWLEDETPSFSRAGLETQCPWLRPKAGTVRRAGITACAVRGARCLEPLRGRRSRRRTAGVRPDDCLSCQQPQDDVCLDCDRFFCTLCEGVCPGCGFDTRSPSFYKKQSSSSSF
jgi:hypothetical protein